MPKHHEQHFHALTAKLAAAHGPEEVERFVSDAVAGNAQPVKSDAANAALWRALAECIAVLLEVLGAAWFKRFGR